MSDKIGAYTVVQALVREGEAYLVKSADGRECTIRLLDVPGDDERLERVRAETLACAALHHPAVAVIADVFEHEGRTAIVGPAPFDGITLAALMDRLGTKNLSIEEVWYIGLQVAAAVSLAHGTQVDGDFIPVCHGHLGPSHVFIGFDGTVRVEGLGLGPLAGESGLTADRGYGAPEQASGGRITPRGDIYSAAAIVFALLSGEKPHEGMSAAELAGQIPETFADAFARALEPKVGNRRITSMELEQYLGELVEEAPGKGKKALAATMAAFKKGETLLGHTRAERERQKHAPQIVGKGPTTKRGGGLLGGALGKRGPSSSRTPPIRSKQNTLLGAAVPRPRLDSKPMDWDAASKAAESISPPEEVVADDLTWGEAEEADSTPTPSPGDWDIADDDSDEEMTRMSEAGAELRAAMDEAKAVRDQAKRSRSDRARPSDPKPSPLGRGPKDAATDAKLADLAIDDNLDEEEGEDLTVMRDRPEAAIIAEARRKVASARGARKAPDSRPSGPGKSSGRGLPRPSGSGAPRPRSSEPETLRSSSPPDEKPDMLRTLASEGVEEKAPQAKKADVVPESRPMKQPIIDIGEPSPIGLDPDLDNAVIPLPPELKSKPEPKKAAAPVATVVVDEPVAPAVASTVASTERAAPTAEADSVPATAPSQPPGDASPWSKEEEAAGEAPKPIPKSVAALIIVVTAVAFMVIGVLVLRYTSTAGPPPSLPSAEPTSSGALSPKPPQPKVPSKPAPAVTAKPTASAAASAQGDVAPPDVDPSKLPSTMGYLTVLYKADPEAIVSVYGKDAGKVGQPNEVSCSRPAFVRVKTSAGAWVNEGQTVVVKCQAMNTVEINP